LKQLPRSRQRCCSVSAFRLSFATCVELLALAGKASHHLLIAPLARLQINLALQQIGLARHEPDLALAENLNHP
jgi:hypothetical protein